MKKLLVSFLLIFVMLTSMTGVFAAPSTSTIFYKDMEDCRVEPFKLWGYVNGSIVNSVGMNYSKGVKMTGSTGGYEAVISAEANSTYELSAYVKVGSCSTMRMGIKNSHEYFVSVNNTNYEYRTVQYTTGSSPTQLILYFYLPGGASSVGYFDNVTLTKTSTCAPTRTPTPTVCPPTRTPTPTVCPPIKTPTPTCATVRPSDYINWVDMGGSPGTLNFYFSAKQRADYRVKIYKYGSLMYSFNYPSYSVNVNGTTWGTIFNPGFNHPKYSDGGAKPNGAHSLRFDFYLVRNGQETLLYSGDDDALLARGEIYI